MTFDQHLDHRLLHSRHGQGVRDKLQSSFPYRRFESKNKQTFILACLYIIFKKTPSSYRGMVLELKEIDMKEVSAFKHEIMHYNDLIKLDINYLIKNFGGVLTGDKMLREYLSNNIKFYTLWFYYLINPNEDIEKLKNSRVFSHVYRKLKYIMMFLTFSEESVNEIELLFTKMEL